MATMSPLRRRMIEDMTVRNLSPATQRSYLYAVAKFSRHFGRSPDRLGLEEVRAFQVHLVATGISWPALNQIVVRAALLLRRDARSDEDSGAHRHAREPQKLPVGAERRRGRALSGGGPEPAQPRGADHGLRRRPAGVGGRHASRSATSTAAGW